MRCCRHFVWATLMAGLLGAGHGGLGQSLSGGATPVEVDGLHNVFRVSPQLYSGSGPDSARAFAALARMGVNTLISVDGARPDVETARKLGLRYIHIPIGYNGVPREKVLQLAKAMKELRAPFYLHCHHGKHRGPAAAAVARLCADEQCSVAEALQFLKKAGTDPRYKGLFESVEKLVRPEMEEWRNARPLVETAPVVGLTQAMVAIDHAFDNLKLAHKAGWKTPPDHPDIDPPHEALQLLEQYQELGRQPAMLKKPADFRRWLHEGEIAVRDLEQILRQARRTGKLDEKAAERIFFRAGAVCNACHAKYRD
jgi:protein tyrosine phosphatase (PTP) superfamily phosphohydrolase (DUF442 family)